MSEKLKIYACSGIGDNAGSSFDYWKDNADVLSNTQAVNNLSTMIESNYLALQLGVTDQKAIELLNDIDLYTVALNYAQQYSGNKEELERVGGVIGEMISAGDFNYGSLDNAERDAHLDKLFAVADERLTVDTINHNDVFDGWWKENVLLLDQVGIDESQRQIFEDCLVGSLPKKARKVLKKSIALNDPNIGKYLKQSGNYFLYTFFTDQQLAKLPYVFTKKHHQQKRIYEYVKSFYVGVYGTEKAMQNEIRNGIIKEFKDTPENVCARIAKSYKGVKGVGVLTEAAIVEIICAVIAAVGVIITGVVKAIFEYKQKTEVAQQQSLDSQIVKDNQMTEEDFDDPNFDLTSGGMDNKYILIGAAVLGLLLLAKK